MPALPQISDRECCKAPAVPGCVEVRQRGSHVIMRRGIASFPVPLHRAVDRGTLRAIIRQSGLPRELFMA